MTENTINAYISSDRLNHCLCIEQYRYIVGIFELSCLFSVCDGFHSCWLTPTWQQFACLSVASSWLLLAVTIITVYLITSNGSVPRLKKQAAYHQPSRLAETSDCFRHNAYMYILYLRSEDNILAILCTGLPITTNIAGQWLNSSIFHTDIKFIIANGQAIIYVGADHICHMTIIHFAQKLLGSTESSLIIIICLWLCTVSYDCSNSILTWLRCNYVIHSVHKEITLYKLFIH